MSEAIEVKTGRSPSEVETEEAAIANLVRKTAQQYRGDGVSLLRLLRTLEALHQEIRDGLFQESLPDNRQALHALLRDIEAEGGWPYITRMRLRSILANFLEAEDGERAEPPASLESVE